MSRRRPALVLPALLVLASAVTAGRLPSSLRIGQIGRPRLNVPRLQRPRLVGRPLASPAQLEERRPALVQQQEMQQEVEEDEPRRPWTPDEPSRRRGPDGEARRPEGEAQRPEGDAQRPETGRGDRLQRGRHGKRKRPSAEHLLFLRSRDSACPRSPSGEEQFFCASHHPGGERACVGLTSLCDGIPDCPEAEDELAVGCLFYNALSSNLEKMTGKLLQLTAHHRDRSASRSL